MTLLEELYAKRQIFLEYDAPIPERLKEEIKEAEKPYLENLNKVFSDIVPSELPVKELKGRIIVALEYDEDLSAIYSSHVEKDDHFVLSEMVKLDINELHDMEEVEVLDEEEFEEVKRIGKSPSTPFKVIFTDEEKTILEDDAISTMIETLKYMGLERVSHFSGKMFKGFHLVDKRKRTTKSKKGKPVKWQKKIDGWWIYAQITNENKIECIKQVADFLKIPVEVELI